ncbi:MAG: hypothetical protein KJO07_25740, partial [Deltaproteobacteria bacterium]|nr:hypothetical protein [Deltaproteobacteria bacterium]
ALWQDLGEGRLSLQLIAITQVAGDEARSQPFESIVDVRRYLDPGEPRTAVPELTFVNDRLMVESGSLLLGGDEGRSVVRLDGCVERGEGCEPIAEPLVPLVPLGEFDRGAGSFAWAPEIAGIRAGQFRGTVTVENHHPDQTVRTSGSASLDIELASVALFGPRELSASLGQYVDIEGAGFVDTSPRGATLLRFVGELEREGDSRPESVDLILVPHFESGRRLRYVLAEDDALGSMLDLRAETAALRGTLQPIASFDDDELVGDEVEVELDVKRVKQVIYLQFTDGYRKSLGLFGMLAADSLIRQRVVEVIERDYQGVNLEVRLEPPSDYALFSTVEVAGADPNGLGLLGNDNTPGKDVGNIRLYDRLGGVNAVTQFDGYPGYGGIFIESLFVYSKHPIGDYRGVDTSATADPRFDQVFGPVRPDRGGQALSATDLQTSGLPSSGAGCPADSRKGQIECAIWAIGSLIGTTVSHEIGHSLGLADPFGNAFHNFGDRPGRIMDRGSARSFGERAELDNQGPGVFCQEHFGYLQTILELDDPVADPVDRPSCD